MLLHPCLSAQTLLWIKDGKFQRKDIQSRCGRKDHFYQQTSKTFPIKLTSDVEVEDIDETDVNWDGTSGDENDGYE